MDDAALEVKAGVGAKRLARRAGRNALSRHTGLSYALQSTTAAIVGIGLEIETEFDGRPRW